MEEFSFPSATKQGPWSTILALALTLLVVLLPGLSDEAGYTFGFSF